MHGTMHGGNDRGFQPPPQQHNMLELVGIAECPFGQCVREWCLVPVIRRFCRRSRRCRETAHVQPGTESLAFARQDNRANALHCGQFFPGFDDPINLLGIERVHLFRPVEPDIGNMIFNRNGDTF